VAMENDKIHEYIPKISLIYFFIIFAFFWCSPKPFIVFYMEDLM
jgi:hypothetical protein